MTIANVVTRGFGNGTLTGTIPFAVTMGYSIGEDLGPWTDKAAVTTNWANQTQVSTTWADQAETNTIWTDKG
jgi:hypothetical protein